jgi:16S rRNA (cytosine967-C5)-methyltransferase
MTYSAQTTSKKAKHSKKDKEDDVLWPRQVALDILQAFWNEERFLDSLFETDQNFLDLDSRNRNFVRMMVTTAVRRSGQIDDIMRRGFSDPKQKMSPPIVGFIFHLAIAQIVFMNVADHAAVNTSVDLTSRNGATRAKGFMNAVLRKVVQNGKNWTTEQDIARLNTPNWLLDIWTKDYGDAQALEIAQASVCEAALDITIADPIDRDKWAEFLECTALPSGSLRRQESAMIPELAGFEEGGWWVQDASAALPVRLMGDLLNKDVIDLCAAPGGKALQLAAGGANVYALDRSAKRMERLKENTKRARLQDKITTEVADAAFWRSKNQFDAVLLDAPCTATGTIRRNPDVAWLKEAEDVESMKLIQNNLLENSVAMLKDDGMLLYCTCSLQKEEGERQLNEFLAKHKEFSIKPILPQEVPELEHAITEEGYLRILPYYWAAYGGLDGFFIGRLVKTPQKA